MLARPIPPTAEALPKPFGPYLLTECIGRGGTAVVYKAKRLGASGFEKQVVVKTILPELMCDPRFLQLFREEARLSGQLAHGNIAQAFDFGVINRTPFLELEYLVGWNLKQIWDHVTARGWRFPVGVALTIATEACRGLAYAHAFCDENGVHRPILHRDISPANVMVCRDGSVKLLDFGLASFTRGETLAIKTFRGKVAYVSPEQVERGEVDRRADVFAFGAVLHELLTGRRIFRGADDAETVRRVVAAEVQAPSKLGIDVPRALDEVVLKALAHDPDDRYQSGAQLLEALENVKGPGGGRRELMAFLGQIAPQVFANRCGSCGGVMAYTAECSSCRTKIDAELPAATDRPRLFVVHTPPYGVFLERSAGHLREGLIRVADALLDGRRAMVQAMRARVRGAMPRLSALGWRTAGRVLNLSERTGVRLRALFAMLWTAVGPAARGLAERSRALAQKASPLLARAGLARRRFVVPGLDEVQAVPAMSAPLVEVQAVPAMSAPLVEVQAVPAVTPPFVVAPPKAVRPVRATPPPIPRLGR
jgi:hypothetical protein